MSVYDTTSDGMICLFLYFVFQELHNGFLFFHSVCQQRVTYAFIAVIQFIVINDVFGAILSYPLQLLQFILFAC